MHGIWAAEHVYTIYNRCFNEIEIISVFAAEVEGAELELDPITGTASPALELCIRQNAGPR